MRGSNQGLGSHILFDNYLKYSKGQVAAMVSQSEVQTLWTSSSSFPPPLLSFHAFLTKSCWGIQSVDLPSASSSLHSTGAGQSHETDPSSLRLPQEMSQAAVLPVMQQFGRLWAGYCSPYLQEEKYKHQQLQNRYWTSYPQHIADRPYGTLWQSTPSLSGFECKKFPKQIPRGTYKNLQNDLQVGADKATHLPNWIRASFDK